jgi:hypothetical protein
MSEFNWVEARAKCSLAEMYSQIRLDVEADVEARNKLLPSGAHYGFKFTRASGRFTVLTESNGPNKSIDFVLSEKYIEILSEKSPMFTATVGLNDDGECILLVNGIERKRWQVAKMALDHIFFEAF